MLKNISKLRKNKNQERVCNLKTIYFFCIKENNHFLKGNCFVLKFILSNINQIMLNFFTFNFLKLKFENKYLRLLKYL